MTGDYTKVPLRPDDRWTGARMQQGRVLLEHDWNLNLDATARTARGLAADVIGPAGVVAGSQDFQVGVPASGTPDVNVHAGRIWVDGLLAYAPQNFRYSTQDRIEPLPESGRALVYLDVHEQEVQPAEAPEALVDPALAPIDSTARTRIGYRVRCSPTSADSCEEAWNDLKTVAGSTGTLSILRAAPAVAADPCAPPGDPLGRLPDGLFRVEVIGPGSAGDARFAWSYENGSPAVAIGQIAGDEVTLRPSAAVTFAVGDPVEVSWLARREDRVPHGALYRVAQPPVGNVLTLDRAPPALAGADGLVLRRWDGEAVGAAAAVPATLRGTDLGVRFKAGAGDYVVGDAWCARVRENAGVGIELRADAPPDGVRHVFAPLALIDLDARAVLHDCRPTFVPLTAVQPAIQPQGGGACTVSAAPGDDLQAAVDSLPAGGGELCLAAGLYTLAAPLRVTSRQRIVICGSGPGTVLRAKQTEAALIVQYCTQIEIRHVSIEGGTPANADPQITGALTVVGSSEVTLSECTLSCPETVNEKPQTCVTVFSAGEFAPDRIRIERNRLKVGAWATGMLLSDVGHAVVAGNDVRLAPDLGGKGVRADGEPLARGLQSLIEAAIRPEAEQGTKPVKVPGAEPLNVLAGSVAEKLIDALVAQLTPSQVERDGALKALLAVARRVTAGPARLRLPQSARAVIDQAQVDLLVVGEGIAVGGTRAVTVQILDNLVEDAVQGISVDVRDPEATDIQAESATGAVPATGVAADTVIIHRNVVHALVPGMHSFDRYGVFVGHARSVHVAETVATLDRTGVIVGRPPTPVDAIRVEGVLGAFVTVSQSSLKGFHTGVRVLPGSPIPVQHMWLVAENMAADGSVAVVAPPTVETERNYP